MKRRERNIDYYRLKRDWSAQCVQRCSECKYICKGNKRIIKDDKLQTLGISFSIPSGVATVGGVVLCARAQVFGYHGTMRAQGSLGNIKWAWGPYWRWSRHPDKSRDTLYSNWILRKIPISCIQRSGSETGSGICLAHPTFQLASVCIYILLPLIIKLFPCYCWFARISLLCYRLCTLVFLMFLALGNELANKWKIITVIHSK